METILRERDPNRQKWQFDTKVQGRNASFRNFDTI